MDTTETTEQFLPEDWELQSFRKYFRGRIVEVLPEAWELRKLSKPIKRNSLRDQKVPHGDGSDVAMELVMLLTVRCSQRKEIEDFSISYEAEEFPAVTLTYIIDDGQTKLEEILKFLVMYVPEHSKNKRIFKSKILETYFDILPWTSTNKILYTNMQWKQRPAALEKLNFKSEETREAYSELERLKITDKCYCLCNLKQRTPRHYRDPSLYYNSFVSFVLAAEQPSIYQMREEVEKYFEEEYKFNSIQSSKLAESFYEKTFDLWKKPLKNIYYRIQKKKNILAILEDLVQEILVAKKSAREKFKSRIKEEDDESGIESCKG